MARPGVAGCDAKLTTADYLIKFDKALCKNTGSSFAETHDVIFCGTIQLQRPVLRQILKLKLGLMLRMTLTDAYDDGQTD
jgi:hypothetical protein